jgi:HEAT repeat protein
VAALGRLRDPVAADTLRALAGDRRTELAIRVHAVHGLARLGSPGSIAVLDELLRHDPAPVVRQAAALALGRAGSLDAVAALESAAKADAHPTVRVQAFASLRALERLAGARLTDVKEPSPKRRLGRGPVRDRTPSASARRRSR